MCSVYENKVKWEISKDILNRIRHSLKHDSDEIAGVLLFSDTNMCIDGTCDKKSTDFRINNGDGASVSTPHGIINFHTHPKKCYIDVGAVCGWPSGEDMRQTIEFARENNLVHIVFTLEGAYVINVKNVISLKDSKIMEKIFKETHIFRSSDQETQKKNFKRFLKPIIKGGPRTNINMWLNLANNLTLKTLYILYNDFYGLVGNKKLKIPMNDDKIFSVELVKIKNNMKFTAGYITESCHVKSFRGGRH